MLNDKLNFAYRWWISATFRYEALRDRFGEHHPFVARARVTMEKAKERVEELKQA